MKTKGTRKTGVLIVGALGMTGSAVIAGSVAMAKGIVPSRFGVTEHPEFSKLNFLGHSDITFGGWDYAKGAFGSQLALHNHLPLEIIQGVEEFEPTLFPGLVTGLDYPPEQAGTDPVSASSVEAAVETLAQNIHDFRTSSQSECVIVVYLGSPSMRPLHGWDRERPTVIDEVPSGLLYALAAVQEHAHFLDFTPGYVLENSYLRDLAEQQGVQLSGRDGSTGQTMLKVTIAELLQRRGLPISAWYSTNLIGNRDGKVLTTPGYDEAKLSDKRDALRLGDDEYNGVRIEYAPQWGDQKESWDAVTARSWLGSEISLRLNWRASDSELAGAMVLDLVRLLEYGDREEKAGLRPELGFFFKRPFLREETSISERWAELVRAYRDPS